MALLPQGIWFQQASQLLAHSAPTGMQGVSPQSLVLNHMPAGPGLNQKIFLISTICFHHSFNTFTQRTENINSVLEEQKYRVSATQTQEDFRWGLDDHEGMQSLQFNKPSHFTVSSEGRTKGSLYDQDYTRWLYSCLCWGSHLFKTTSSNISKAQWPHLASWSQSVENSFTTLLTVLQTYSRWDEEREHWSFLSLFCTWFCSPLFRINIFPIPVAPPLQESLCWCTKRNECQGRSTAVKPPTSHPQDPDNISYCLPVCALASLQRLVYNPFSSASEPKKTSLM